MITQKVSDFYKQCAWFTDGGEFDFESIEKSLNDPILRFGNPDSKLTEIEQFHLWKRMIQEGLFVDRDDFCNKMAAYSSYQQAQQHLDSLHPVNQE